MIAGPLARPTIRAAGLATALVAGLWTGDPGPYDIPLRAGPAVPGASGAARLHFAESPFGIAVTQDGRARYDIRITAEGLPDPSSLGPYRVYVAWETTTDLSAWRRLGTVRNGTSSVGPADWNKFLLVITAEADSAPAARAGPTVLHGYSPSTWLQQFLTHPLFRGISQ